MPTFDAVLLHVNTTGDDKDTRISFDIRLFANDEIILDKERYGLDQFWDNGTSFEVRFPLLSTQDYTNRLALRAEWQYHTSGDGYPNWIGNFWLKAETNDGQLLPLINQTPDFNMGGGQPPIASFPVNA
jgi:hypothetical protein